MNSRMSWLVHHWLILHGIALVVTRGRYFDFITDRKRDIYFTSIIFVATAFLEIPETTNPEAEFKYDSYY